MESLATKYRPKTFSDLVEQDSVKTILLNQLESGEIKNAYLFAGPAGDGKTTTARIFANEVNKGQGSPIELDAASNNGVDDVRAIIQESKTKSLESEYKIFILDEVHSFSNNAWQAMLKLLEEPPAKAIFILCTTNPEKIPKTILSRVQRYDFQRISQQGIADRLEYIIDEEFENTPEDEVWNYSKDSLEYIAKIADGGMRDAITMLDKCLAFSKELTIENVVTALGVADYDLMNNLTRALLDKQSEEVTKIVNSIYSTGKDLKVFAKTYTDFVLDLCKYGVTKSYEYIQIPQTVKLEELYKANDYYYFTVLLKHLVRLNDIIKWDTTPKSTVEAMLLLECFREN
ncbi:MAG: DNA polymerase III subunit gamma/tau [Paludibacteraceae bacterium]|nr:DNA polymerase III subunit gamma/tau [Paludibacteraceae bacterium]